MFVKKVIRDNAKTNPKEKIRDYFRDWNVTDRGTNERWRHDPEPLLSAVLWTQAPKRAARG